MLFRERIAEEMRFCLEDDKKTCDIHQKIAKKHVSSCQMIAEKKVFSVK